MPCTKWIRYVHHILEPFAKPMSGHTYLVDAFSTYAASAVAAMRTSMSIYGTFLPLAGPPLFKSLGLGWGNTVLCFVSLIMATIPLLFFKYETILSHLFHKPLIGLDMATLFVKDIPYHYNDSNAGGRC